MEQISNRQKAVLTISGLILCIIFLEIALRIGGIVFVFLQELRNEASIAKKGACRIVCLGDSMTAGAGSYPAILEHILNQRNMKIEFSVINKGIPATTTESILSQSKNNIDKYKPDIVVTMMGITDGYYKGFYLMPYKNAYAIKNRWSLYSFKVYKLMKFWAQALHFTVERGTINTIPIKIAPRNDMLYVSIGKHYKNIRDYEQAIRWFKKVLKTDPFNDTIYGHMTYCYKQLGKNKEAEECSKKANKLRRAYYNPITRNNYQKLREILSQKGIQLVCVQYPVRNVEPLKNMFDDTEGIIFVDNEKIFKEAIEKTSYSDYFIDDFAGDFGHCTPLGNKLLAENIAKIISKEYFKEE